MSTATPDAQQMRLQLDTWNVWLEERTDRLLALEERCRLTGTTADEADVAAAFVARKSIGERLAAVTALAGKDREGAASMMGQPLVDSFGATVGSDVNDAAKLLDAILASVSQRIDEADQRRATDAALIVAIEADLNESERLSSLLGEQVNAVAQLRRRQSQQADARALAASAAQLRAALQASEADRQRLLSAMAANDERVAHLAELEIAVREIAATCRAKVLAAPALAVPSVAALGPAPCDAGGTRPWVAVRAEMEPYVDKVDRVERALGHAKQRFQAALDERDDLRGLLQGFRDKAAGAGFGEDPAIEPLYREAAALLWSAPCDVASARPLVDRYVTGVNRLVALGKLR